MVSSSTLAHCTTYDTSLAMLITDCVLSLILQVFDHCMYCTECDTDPLTQFQGEVLRYTCTVPTTAHSMTLSSTVCLSQVTEKKADRVHTGLT